MRGSPQHGKTGLDKTRIKVIFYVVPQFCFLSGAEKPSPKNNSNTQV